MTFVARIFEQLTTHADAPLVTEVHGRTLVPTTGRQLHTLTRRARTVIAHHGARGDRAVLLAPNSARWVAADLALLADGRVVVPLYRQDPRELVAMIRAADPSLVVCATLELAEALRGAGWDTPPVLFEELFAAEPTDAPPAPAGPDDDVTIIYTSGTSAAAKGVVSRARHVDYRLPVTAEAIGAMMRLGADSDAPTAGGDRVFHYLPFCFSGSRIVLWTCLWRGNGIMVSTDLDNLAEELGAAQPHYFLNVPMLLERIKNGVEKNIRQQRRPVQWLYDRAVAAHRAGPAASRRQRLALAVANRFVFSQIRQKIGANLRCLICGSAPLGADTQRWFQMLGIPVYQVYGLTETTAIVTMDRPPEVKAGRVGRALPGVELRLGDGDELLVRGPNVFDRYWRRPEATAEVFIDGWFRTGDQAEVDGDGVWRIVGRTKNLIVPTSGHNVAPEPLEQRVVEGIEGVEQALVVGHGRPHLAVLVVGDAPAERVQAGLDRINEDLPHYRKIRRFTLLGEPFTIENGLLTANRKLKRTAIERQHAAAIDAMYGTSA